MPQLNPNPWFFILLLSWTTLLVFKTKTLMTSQQNQPKPSSTTKQTTPWDWPWT